MMRQSRLAIVVFGAVCACLGGIYALWSGLMERSLYLRGTEIPLRLRAAELKVQGGSDNVHVEIVEYQFGSRYVYEMDRDRRKRILIPIMAVGDYHGPFRILLTTHTHLDNAALEALQRQEALRGVLANDIASLSHEERRHLAALYQDTDFERVLLFQVDRAFPSAGLVYGLLGGGAALLALGLVLSAVAWRSGYPTPATER